LTPYQSRTNSLLRTARRQVTINSNGKPLWTSWTLTPGKICRLLARSTWMCTATAFKQNWLIGHSEQWKHSLIRLLTLNQFSLRMKKESCTLTIWPATNGYINWRKAIRSRFFVAMNWLFRHKTRLIQGYTNFNWRYLCLITRWCQSWQRKLASRSAARLLRSRQ